uniref:OmpH family outer membrane protein n=1 Tax=Roseihalotalea indica TaxID=2867963 RepID=A0AA49GQ23_9BACT|nr:OmpH family outer membrane protein [Tunicatimonas sp. TK19036]
MRNSILIFVCLLSAFSLNAQAQDLKIGVVQSDFILAQLPETKTAQQDIATFEKKLNNKILAMRQGLEQQYAAYQQNSANLPDSVRAEREQELQALQQDITQEQRTAQQQMQFKVMQSMNPIEQKVRQTIDSVAQANGYTHVFPNSLSNQPIFLYIQKPDEANITPLVMEALGISTAAADTSGK